MHADLTTRRRVLLLTYQRYTAAERAWTMAQQEMKAWFPTTSHHSSSRIGNPGSAIRRLYDQRERAVLQLEVARLKLEVAKQRLEKRHRDTLSPVVFLLT